MRKLTSAAALNNRTEMAFRYVEAYNKMDVEKMIADFDY